MSDPAKTDYYTAPPAGDFAAAAEPFALFADWYDEARAHEPNDANAVALANRHFGIGCDQLLVVEAPSKQGVDFRYRIFNADGVS